MGVPESHRPRFQSAAVQGHKWDAKVELPAVGTMVRKEAGTSAWLLFPARIETPTLSLESRVSDRALKECRLSNPAKYLPF